METSLNITKALADGNRMRAVAALMERDELCVCQLTEMLGLATATVSRHMSILQTALLVKSRKEGRWVFYCLAKPFPDFLFQWLTESISDSPEIKKDRKKLDYIETCNLDDLCRQQKARKA